MNGKWSFDCVTFQGKEKTFLNTKCEDRKTFENKILLFDMDTSMDSLYY